MSADNTKKEQLKIVLNNLAMDIAMHDKLRFDPHKGPEEIVRLLQCAAASSAPEVQQTFAKASMVFTPGHKRFFEEKGIVFPKHSIPVANTNASSANSDSSPGPGKRKIVYRGQVKWV